MSKFVRRLLGGGPGSGRYPKGSSGNGASAHDTQSMYRHADGSWDADREKLHQQIIAKAFEGKTPHPEGPEATLMGGGSGSGKTTLGNQLKIGNENTVRVDSDALKAELPEYAQYQQSDPTNAAALTHEESSYLAKAIMAKAVAGKYDMVYDSTSSGKTGPAILDRLQDNGYKTHLLFADVSTDEAKRRADSRARQVGTSDFGRVIPQDVINSSHQASASNFMRMKDHPGVSSAHLYDTTTRTPQLVYGRSGDRNTLIPDNDRWAAYQKKAKG